MEKKSTGSMNVTVARGWLAESIARKWTAAALGDVAEPNALANGIPVHPSVISAFAVAKSSQT